MPYAHDTAETIYNALEDLEAKIEQAGQNVHFSGQQAAQKKAKYEELKNKMLIQMFADEASGTKRTVDQRQAIYRATYAQERLEWQLAENEWKASNDYLKALLGNQISTEVRLKILESDMRFAGRSAVGA
jgi:polyribonucleotide nucleotidyltransferase